MTCSTPLVSVALSSTHQYSALESSAALLEAGTVAAEAGISTGSFRHVFPGKTELLVHATELVGRRARVRIQRHLAEPEPRALVLPVVEELPPLDAERRLEMEVTVALIAEAPGNARVREVLDESYEVVREVCRRLVTRLRRAGLTRAGRRCRVGDDGAARAG